MTWSMQAENKQRLEWAEETIIRRTLYFYIFQLIKNHSIKVAKSQKYPSYWGLLMKTRKRVKNIQDKGEVLSVIHTLCQRRLRWYMLS